MDPWLMLQCIHCHSIPMSNDCNGMNWVNPFSKSLVDAASTTTFLRKLNNKIEETVKSSGKYHEM